MSSTRRILAFLVFGALTLGGCDAIATDRQPSRAEALAALNQPEAQARRAGVVRLGAIGIMADADRLVALLRDEDPQVRFIATTAMWQIWSRSGDKAMDTLYQRGIDQMQAGQLREAIDTFSGIIRRKPAFAEAWNKRATIYFMMGEFELSLKDCAEVVKRNPNHFGALSGYGQIYLNLGDLDRALDYFERALKVNPNLPGAASTVLILRERLDNQQRKTI